ncbi:amino acid transporter [Gordoniibacillus kamchatkensis]|uniref:Amino acid transporter n=1 Tax=Gordoniibacillus kamchatkensis TaxID=1590651 RepID=A0ABR5AMU5_9BACL|nr:APC family permease [Paenibacillus sp. VKM B-2647]KIL42276.1 amino acid transporter [Paenibacillus sp. VKM B-2647]
MNAEFQLKKELSLRHVVFMAIGQIIGAGVMSLTGIAIALTGTGVTPAFVLSAILTLITTLPTAIMGAAIPSTGGAYKYTSRLLSPRLGFFFLLIFLIANLTLATYAISFAKYFQALVPAVNFTLIAILILTLCYVVNLFGVRFAASAEGVLVVVKLIAVAVFIVWGVPKIHWDALAVSQMFPSGLGGFLTATGLVSFATGGASIVAELGGEMKNPKRDIPLTIIITTAGVAVIYAFMAAVASGVLPIAQVAGKHLTDVAKEILPYPLFLFFIIGGSMFAITSTLNSTLSWVTKGFLIACDDGWLPKGLGAVNKKFGTPHWLLSIFYLVGLIPLVTGVSLESVTEMGLGLYLINSVLPVLAATQLPKKYPELYEKSMLRMKPRNLYFLVGISVVLQIFQGVLLLKNIPATGLYLSAAFIVLAALYVWIVGGTPRIKNRKLSGFADDTAIQDYSVIDRNIGISR